MFTSLSTSAGTPKRSESRAPTGWRFQPGRHRAAAGDGLKAADVPASAHDVVVVGDVDVADVAGGTLGAAVDAAVGDDAAADAGADLDEQQVVGVAPA